jgi:hypothetical protein
MKNPRSGGPRPAPKRPTYQPIGGREKWTTELPPTTLVALKVRAAQERRPIHEVLRSAIEAYVQTAVPG